MMLKKLPWMCWNVKDLLKPMRPPTKDDMLCMYTTHTEPRQRRLYLVLCVYTTTTGVELNEVMFKWGERHASRDGGCWKTDVVEVSDEDPT